MNDTSNDDSGRKYPKGSTDGRTLFKQSDHKVQVDGVEAALHKILGS